MSGVRGYGECEMVFAILKISAVVMFVVTGIVIDCGGGPNGKFIGFKYWKNPGNLLLCSILTIGSFNNGFKGLCSVLITAAFSLAGTELVGLAAAETDNPRKTIPQATKQVFWRLILFYFSSIFVVACIVPYTHPQLVSSSHSADLRASPFVIAIHEAGIKALPSVINAVILISVLSVGNSSTYASTRTLHALADVGQAPKFLQYVDRAGRPLAGQVCALGCGFIAYFSCFPGGAAQMFDWLLQLSALSSFLTWASICVAHIRFRSAMTCQGQSIKSLPFRACFGVYGSYLGLTLNILCVIAQLYLACFPIGGKVTLQSWMMDFVAVPIILGFFVIWKLCKSDQKGGWVRLAEMDLVTGKKEELSDVEDEAIEQARPAPWRRFVRIFC
jgi:yeast amino acid transporter